MTVLSIDGIGSPSCGRHLPNRHGTHGKTDSTAWQGSSSVKEKLAHGMLPESALPAQLGPDVWSPRGVKILTKIDHGWRTRGRCGRPCLGFLIHCAWQILLQCQSQMPPSQVARYAHGHDQGMMANMEALFEGLPGDVEQKMLAQRIAIMRMGGLGLRSATRMSPAAYWASLGRCPHDLSTTS